MENTINIFVKVVISFMVFLVCMVFMTSASEILFTIGIIGAICSGLLVLYNLLIGLILENL